MSESKRSSGYYARIMGTFWRHPRTSGLSLAARGLWVSLLSWCADQRSDGEVPPHAVAMICGGRADGRAMSELTDAGLVHHGHTALVLRDWAQHNITRADHDREKERARNGMARKRAVTRNSLVTPAASYASVSDQEQEHEQITPSGVIDASARAVPTQPVESTHPTPIPAPPRGAGAAFAARCEVTRQALAKAAREARGVVPPSLGLGTSHSREVTDIARWLATADGVDLGAMARRWAGAKQRDGKWVPLLWLARDPTEWATDPPSASAVRLTPEQDQASIEDLMRAGGAM